MTTNYDQALAAADLIRARTLHLQPSLGIILGTGLGNFASAVENPTVIPYADLPGFPQPTVEGHAGRLVLGVVAGTPVAVMQGRIHSYEGYSAAEVVFPTRVLGLLGCTTLLLTNASGGINPAFTAGSLVLIADHINLTGTHALLGPNEPRFAVRPGAAQRFFDMSGAYSPHLRALARAEAARQGLSLSEGIYVAVLGPSFETPAEIRGFRALGADLVGMSTVHEVIAARHMGVEVLALSLVTNPAAGVSPEPIDHTAVLEVGRRAEQQFTSLVTALIPQLPARIGSLS